MGKSMTPRERLHNTLDGKTVDRFFRYELGAWPTTIKRWKSEGLPSDFDFNQHFCFDPFFRLPFNTGYTDSPIYPRFDKEIVEKGEDWEIIRDVDGIVKKVLSTDSDLSMPQFIQFPVVSRTDWLTFRERLNPENAPKLLGDIMPIARMLSVSDDIPVLMPICGAFGHPRNLMGDINLCYTLYDDPDLLHEILDNWLILYKRIIQLITEHIKVDCMLIWEDMCYKNGPLIGPNHFRTFILPRYVELIKYAKEHGIKYVWVDTDGDLLKLIPMFVEAGVSALLPFEVQSGMDIVKIRKQFGTCFTIIGGIDKRALAGTKEDIKIEVDRVLPFFINSRNYIPCLDHTVPVNVSLENFKYYLDCIRRYE